MKLKHNLIAGQLIVLLTLLFTVPAKSACTVPTGLTTTSITSSSAVLGWNVVAEATSYRVRYKKSTSWFWTTVTVTTNSRTLTGLSASTSYQWKVLATCSTGSTAYSSTQTFSTTATCVVPSGLTASSITTTSATLGWNSVNGAASYNIRYRKTGTSTWTSTTSTTTSKAISGLTASSTYEFQLQTVCTGGGVSAWSASANFTTLAQSCSVPTGLTSGSITSSGATLGWGVVSGAVSYNIRHRPTGSSTWTSTTSTTNSKGISGLTATTTYEFQVQTVCTGGGTSVWSPSATFTTLTAPCIAPTGLSTSSITQSSATVSWNAAAGAVSYSIQYRKTGTSSWSNTTSTNTSKTLSGLLPATNYEFQVMTVCSGGNSAWSGSSNFTTANSTTLPVPDHIVILIEENHGYSQIIGSSSAPYINALANDPMSTLFTQMYGVEHPSQPNYLDLFSGSNQGMTNNNVPSAKFTTPNLARELLNAGKTFITYSQNLPSVGYDGSSSGQYKRKHNPVANWMGTGTNQVPSTLNQPFSAFPSDYSTLPTVSFVVPDQDYDMHDGSISAGDTWFYNNLNGYVQWAKTHNSLFILIFDEDDGNYNNRIPMIFTGPMVKSGTLSTTYNHYNVLRTIEDMYGTTHAGNAASAASIHGCWVNGYKQSADIKLPGEGFSWEVFPNPASNMINITYEMADVTDPNVTVYNNLGQKLTNFFLPETGNGTHQVSFSTAELRMNKGIYFLEIQVSDKKYLKKIAVLE